ncbi:MAG: metal ABC transporter substrate-binding protein [Flaviflexus sp.]|uniref:metal ABC transporter substrate-binding protein n=1 Tax=Flaviflexus sp. TaxID=1969482 RepID=UPI00352CC368
MKRMTPIAGLGAVALALAACSSTDSDDSDATGDNGAAIDVTTSIYPLAYVAEEVGGDRVNVTTLTPAGSDDHNLELSPRQVNQLDSVDLVIYASQYQGAMDDAINTTSPERVIDAMEYVDVADDIDHSDHDHGDDDHADEDAHDHESEDAEGTEDDHDHDAESEATEDDHDHAEDTTDESADSHAGHDHSGPDPHFWLDPTQTALLAHPVAEQLAEIDPDNADEYRANADALVASLTELDEDFHAGLAQCESRDFVVSHEAFGYLANAYDLHQHGIAGIEIDTEPSPRRVAEVTELIEETGVSLIFATSDAEMSITGVLAEEAGVEVDILDAGATQRDENVDYEEIMRTNLTKLQSALGCS